MNLQESFVGAGSTALVRLRRLCRRFFRTPLESLKCIRIETTNRCNLRCTMCPQSSARRTSVRGFMPFDLFKRIVDQVSTRPLQDASFYLHICGEPLLHRNLVDCISYTSSKGLKPILTTNATLLSPEMSEKLLNSGLHKIEFSFEGIDRDVYETTRVGAKYEVVLRNIMAFVEKNRARGKPVSTELVVVDLPQVDVRLARIFCQQMQPFFDVVNLSGYFDWLGKVESVEFERSHYLGCGAVDTDLNVLWDGRVVPCCMDIDGEMVIGDFSKMRFLEILNAKARQDLRRRLRAGNLDGLLCERCAVPWGGRKVRGIPSQMGSWADVR